MKDNIKHNKSQIIDIILILFSKGYGMVLYLIVDVFLANMLSASDYGQWLYFYSIITICFCIAKFGLDTSTKVFVAKNEFNKERQNSYIKSAIFIRVLISIIVSSLLGVVVFIYAEKTGINREYPLLAKMSLIGILLIIVYSFNEFFKELYMGLVKFSNNFWVIIIEYTGYLILGCGFILIARIFIKSVNEIIFLEFGYIVALTISVSIGVVFLCKIYRSCSVANRGTIKKAYVKELMKYSMPLLFASISMYILLEIDTIMLGIYCSSETVAIYAVAKNICSKLRHINATLSTVLMTSFAIINEKNVFAKEKELKRYIMLNIVVTGMVILLTSTIITTFIPYIYGETYIESKQIVLLLLPYYAFSSLSYFFETFLDYQGKAKQRGICCLCVLALEIFFNMILIPHWGARGAALGTSLAIIPYPLMMGILIIKTFRKYKNRHYNII